MRDDKVIKALADPTRRRLLDRLFESDGQILSRLTADLSISRQAASKHLRILEDAGLVSVSWEGREKRHFLNPVPIQQISERWIHKFRARHAAALTALKGALEKKEGGGTMSGPVYQYELFIGAAAERVWEALTSAEFTRRYFYGTAVESDWEPGAAVVYRNPDGTEVVEGKVLESMPPNRLAITWRPLYAEELAAEPPSRVTFEIEAVGAACRLRVTHDQFIENSRVYDNVRQGWSAILCSLKSLLETGQPLPVAGNEPQEASR